jgi:hypothetical protein
MSEEFPNSCLSWRETKDLTIGWHCQCGEGSDSGLKGFHAHLFCCSTFTAPIKVEFWMVR